MDSAPAGTPALGTEKVSSLLAFTLAGMNVLLAKTHRRGIAAEKDSLRPRSLANSRAPTPSTRSLVQTTDSSRTTDAANPSTQPTRPRRPTRRRGGPTPAVRLLE